MDNEVTIVVKARDETDAAFARIASKARGLKAKVNLDVDIDRDRLAGRLVSAVGALGGAAAQAAGGALGGIASAVGALGPVAAAAAAGMAALAAATSVVPGLIMAVAAAAAAAIPVIAGLGAVGGVLKLGFGGIAGALQAYGKAVGGAGGGSSGAANQMRAAARQILAAEESLAEAKRRAVRASQEVTRAREREIERLEDLKLAIRGAALEQEDAVLGLERAQERMKELQRQQAENELTDRLALTGVQRERFDISPTDVKEAELAIRQAKLRLDEAKESAGDLAQEQAKAARVGVDGSEQVQQALENQRQANLAVTQAARQLQYAHEDAAQSIGGGGAAGAVDQFAEAMKKLSPNARELVYALLKIKERFDGIRLAVQDRLLEGFAGGVTKLADRWLPALGQLLPEIAGKLNRVGLELMDALGQPEFVENISVAVRGFGRVIDRLRPALVGLVDTFGDLSKAATPIMEKLADRLSNALISFSMWIDKAAEDGSLEEWFDKAAKAAENLWQILQESFGLLGDIIEIAFGKSDEKEPLGGLLDGLRDLRRWLKDNQEEIRDFISAVKFMGSVVVSVFRAIVGAIGLIRRGWQNFVREYRAFRSSVEGISRGIRDWLIRFFGGSGSWLYVAGRNLVTGLVNGIRSVMPNLRSATNLVGAIAGGIGGLFAHGGIIGAASGGARSGLTMVGEHGRELVKLPAGSQVYGNEATERMLGGGGGPPGNVQVQVTFSGNTDSAFATAFMKLQNAGAITFKSQLVR